MTKQSTAKPQPLDPKTIVQPFDLSTALTYMRDNGEVIRGQTGGQDFYFFLDVQRRPVLVNGRRIFRTIESITGVYRWGGNLIALPLSELTGDHYYIMNFDEIGQPIWDEPAEEEVVGEEG